MNKPSVIIIFLGTLAAVVLLAVVLALPTQFLWNEWLVGAVNGINRIGFWQALGINILSGILFKSTNTNKQWVTIRLF